MPTQITSVFRRLGNAIREFTVAGFKYDNLFAHRWYIGCDNDNVEASAIRELLDKTLCELNDDYEVERTSALKEVFVEVLTNSVFYEYLRSKGKEGAMNKFPRVVKGKQLEEWEQWLRQNHVKTLSST